MAPGTTERLTRSPFLGSVLLYTCFASALSSSAIAQADPTHVGITCDVSWDIVDAHCVP
jgi:hypothetical protein